MNVTINHDSDSGVRSGNGIASRTDTRRRRSWVFRVGATGAVDTNDFAICTAPKTYYVYESSIKLHGAHWSVVTFCFAALDVDLVTF